MRDLLVISLAGHDQRLVRALGGAARLHRSERERDKRPKRWRDRREWRVPLFSS
jgi:hypothetical protein